MTAIAPHVTAFFRERLTMERRASIHTCDSYAYAFKLLLGYASKRLKVAPSRLELEQIDAPLVAGTVLLVPLLHDVANATWVVRLDTTGGSHWGGQSKR